jgi:hypothetical protein
MPRLTNKQYLERHRALRRIWLEGQKFFGVLDYNQQMEVHAFYAPARDWTDEELLEHRLKAQELDASLPQRASRGFIKIEAAFLAPRPVHSTPAPRGKGKLRVIPIARPEVNTKQLARAFIDMAREQVKTEQEKVA